MRLLTLMTLLGFSMSGFAQNITKVHSDLFTQSRVNLTEEMIHTISSENKCAQGGIRSSFSIELKSTTTYGEIIYAGVTSYGDITLVQNRDGKTIADIYICPRAGLNGKGQVLGDFELDGSLSCPLGQVNAANLILDTDHRVKYEIAFAPIDIPGTDRVSSLCHQVIRLEHSDKQRNSQKDFEDIPYNPKIMGIDLGSSVIGY